MSSAALPRCSSKIPGFILFSILRRFLCRYAVGHGVKLGGMGDCSAEFNSTPEVSANWKIYHHHIVFPVGAGDRFGHTPQGWLSSPIGILNYNQQIIGL